MKIKKSILRILISLITFWYLIGFQALTSKQGKIITTNETSLVIKTLYNPMIATKLD